MSNTQKKIQALIQAELDPNKYWLDDDGNVIDMPEDNTPLTALKAAAFNAPSTALGVSGSALGLTAAGLLAPATGGASLAAGVAGATAGGAAGGALGKAIQETVYPESWQLAQEARAARSPGTVMAADVAASTLAMRPSPKVIGAALRAPRELLSTAGQMQPQTREALLNIGVGAGLSGGMAAAQGAPIGDVALQTLIGAAQHQPTRLGTALSGGVFRPFTDMGAVRPGAMPTAEAMEAYRAALEAQNAPVAPEATIDPGVLAAMQKASKDQQRRQAKVVSDAQILAEAARMRAADAERAPEVIPPGGVVMEGPQGTKPFTTREPGQRAEPQLLDPRTIDERLAAAEEAELPRVDVAVEPEPAAPAPSDELRGASPLERRLKMIQSPELMDYLKSWADKFKATITGVKDMDKSGVFKPRRSADVPSEILYNEKRGYVDVLPHEALHGMIDDALNYGTPREQAAMQRILNSLGLEVKQNERGRFELDATAEEALVARVGEGAFEAIKDPQAAVRGKESLMDFMDYYLRKLTPQSAERILRNRLVFGSGAPAGVRNARPVMPTLDERKESLEESAKIAEENMKKAPEATPEEAALPVAKAAPAPKPVDRAADFERARLVKEKQDAIEAQRAAEEDARQARIERDALRAEAENDRLEAARAAAEGANAPEASPGAPSAQRAPSSFATPTAPRRGSVGSARRGSQRAMRGVTPEDVMPGSEVTRPETRTYEGESIPQNIRRGRMEREVARETPEDLEMRRIEARLSGEERPRFQELEELRPQLKRWLRGAEPIRAFHGGMFPAAGAFKLGDGVFGKGIYFSSDRSIAEQYSKQRGGYEPIEGGRTDEYYVRLVNPLKVAETAWPEAAVFEALGLSRERAEAKASKLLEDKGALGGSVKSLAEKQGYDGIIYERKDGSKEYALFDSNQAKLVESSDGSFSDSPDVRYQELQPERVFLSEFEKELSRENPFRFQVGKDGRINANDIRVAVKKLNESEREMLDEAGLSNFLMRTPRPTKDELSKWADENLPKIEVKELWAEGEVDKYEQEITRLRHEMDTRFPTFASKVDENLQWKQEYLELKDQYDEAWRRRHEADPEMLDSATRAYTMVNPRELADMPGAVDLLVRIPVKNAKPKLDASETHYAQSGDNLLAHVRAYEHTMPNGEKVLRVFEVQSDWAQTRRKEEVELKKRTRQGTDGNWYYTVPDYTVPGGHSMKFSSEEDMMNYIAENTPGFPYANDPLLPQHQRLALKAAIEHARKRGINKLVVDDAETAMLTEWHDKVAATVERVSGDALDEEAITGSLGSDARYSMSLRYGPDWRYGTYVRFHGTFYRVDKVESNYDSFIDTAKALQPYGMSKTDRFIPQEGGMRLAYDNVLQQQMRDMAGEGTKVDLGEHKNAFGEERTQSQADMYGGEPGRQPRPDLIFKNLDGTPKTTSTGYLYDISAPQARREAGEPFSLTGRRYQPLGPERGSFKGAKLPERETAFRGIFAGNVEALRRTGDPDKISFAGIADELYARIRNYTGKYENALIAPLENLSTESRNRIIETMYDEDMDRKSYATRLNAKEQIAHRAIRGALKRMRQEQIAANQRINGKPAGIDQFYFPNIIDSTILHDLANSPESARAKEAERQFVEFNKDLFVKRGVPPADAQTKAVEAFGKFIGSLKPMAIDSGFDYGAVSLPASTKLPPTWIQGDAVESFRNYAKRFGRARAFYDVMGRDENAMRLLGRKNYFDAAGKEVPVTNPGSRLVRDPNVRNLMESALGVTHESQEGWTPAVGRLANTLLLSNVMSRLTDVSTTPFKALSYLPVTQLPGLVKNLGNMRQSMENAYNTGGVRRGGLMVVREVLGAGDAYINKLDKVTQFITRVTGSEALERGSRFLSQNIGEYIYDVNSALARAGDKRADEFLRRLAPQWDTLAREEVAQRIAQLFQGRYDATNLPNWIQNSPAAPFFSMMKWNIEQWNNFKRFAWEPAKQGDVMPLVKTILGGVIGGLAVGEMREKITGKKQRVATFEELKYGFDEGDKTQAGLEAMRKAAFLAQVTGTIGVVGELALQGLDIAARDKPQGFSWPAFNLAASVLARVQNAGNAAIDNSQDAGLILGTAVNDLAKEVFTQYRIAMSVPDRVLKGSRGETEQANRRRDLRMSEKLRGEEVRRSPYIEADYAGTRERRFDREADMNKALEIARTLDKNARASSKTAPEYLEKRRKFRAMRIAGIPSVDNDPMQYFRHLQYVRTTQGAEAADALAADYARLRMEQKFKSGLFR